MLGLVGFKAVIFDFYGTLTVAAGAAERALAMEAVGAALGVEPAAFRLAWTDSWEERCTGRLGDIESNLTTIAGRCGHRPTSDQVAAAVAVRWEHERRFFSALRPDAVSTLRTLRESGLRTALVSDCTHELPQAWHELPVAPYVEVPVFSISTNAKKPDPLIYQQALDGLGLPAEACLYVGDGGSYELTGAESLGMTARRVREYGGPQLRYETDDWSGPELPDLATVLKLV